MSTTEAPPASTKTQVKDTIPMSLETRRATGSKQWFLEDEADAMAPVFHYNTVQYFVCGKESFEKIAEDIRAATTNIDIVCWGFDPCMELIRDKATHWPRGDTWASLLYGAATGKFNDGKRVKVRILLWYNKLAESHVAHNAPGYRGSLTGAMLRLFTNGKVNTEELLQLFTPGSGDKRSEGERSLRRKAANVAFYQLLGDKVKQEKEQISIELVVRDSFKKDVDPALTTPLPNKDEGIERLILSAGSSYHQKTILIDYESTEKAPVGYVMGLNSVTNYWDTEAHLFNDPRRARQFENSPPSKPVPPLRDYASRLQGECLVMVSKNFSDAWRKYAPKPIERDNDPKKPPAHLTKGLGITPHSAQIVRTEPLVQERTIERLYYQIAKSARDYLYLENQYFQYAPFLQHLKEERAKYVEGQRNGKTPKEELPMLHLMVITCLPENVNMVPRTHDAIKELGYGDSMPEQSAQVNSDIKGFERNGGSNNGPEKQLSDIAQTYLQSGGGLSDATIKAELSDPDGKYAMRTLLACLCSFNTTAVEDAERAYKDYIAARKAYDAQLPIYKDEYARWVRLGSTGTPPPKPQEPQEPPQPSTLTPAQLQARKKDLYQEIYIHSKLAITDDSFVTLGSANMNIRSYFSDGELNVGCDDPKLAAALRKRVWGRLAGVATAKDDKAKEAPSLDGGKGKGSEEPALDGGAGKGQDLEDTVTGWLKLIKKNGKAQDAGKAIEGLLVPFLDKRTSRSRQG